MSPTDVMLPPEAVAALENGRIIDAIKIVREATGLGLKESKDAVDRHLAAHPELRQRASEAGAGSLRGALMWIALLLIGTITAFLLARPRP